jgi:hypothetical protein
VADGLSSILRNNVFAGDITSVKVCRRAPGILHLLFANDTLLFFEASQVQAERVKIILDLYGRATGQSLNYSKCSMFIGCACPDVVQEHVRAALSVTSLVFEGRMSKGCFQNLQTSMIKRLIQWGWTSCSAR